MSQPWAEKRRSDHVRRELTPYWKCQIAGWSVYGGTGVIIPTLYDGLRWPVLGRAVVGMAAGLALTHVLRQRMVRDSWLALPVRRLPRRGRLPPSEVRGHRRRRFVSGRHRPLRGQVGQSASPRGESPAAHAWQAAEAVSRRPGVLSRRRDGRGAGGRVLRPVAPCRRRPHRAAAPVAVDQREVDEHGLERTPLRQGTESVGDG